MEVLREGLGRRPALLRRTRFNPCFNGSVERGLYLLTKTHLTFFGFNPCFNGSVERGKPSSKKSFGIASFNPCFNGSVERGCLAPVVLDEDV